MRVVVQSLLGCALLVGVATLPGFAEPPVSPCADCHEDVVAAFARTGHAVAPGWKAETGCQSCHGPGDAHMESLEATDIVRPQLLPRREASDSCLNCHERLERHFDSPRSTHRLNDVGCLDCHNPHLAAEHMLVAEPLELCSSCHFDVAAQFDRPRSHPLEKSGDACATCHDPHGSLGPRVSGTTTALQTCESCHFEKVGPFVYDHSSLLVDGCGSCHDAHASTNRHLLRHESQLNLCYECHAANATPGWHSAARFADQKCTSCHSAIHGSNTSQFFLED